MKYARITNTTSGKIVVERARIADSWWSRFRGLMWEKQISEDEALLIEPCSSIHTMFMRFTIDVVFVDRDLRVVKVTTVPPYRAALARGARSVLEMAEGAAARLGIEAGQVIAVEAEGAASQTK